MIKHGQTSTGEQSYLCKDYKDSFPFEYTYNAYKQETKKEL